MKTRVTAGGAHSSTESPRHAEAFPPAALPAIRDGLRDGRRLLAMNTASLLFLVVEDNQDFLHILCEMLHSLGHRTCPAQSAEEALELVAQNRFDVLLSDISLPGISGIDLARRVVKTAPGTRIIFSSGYGYLLSDALDFEFDLLHKPYFVNQLRLVIG